MKVINNIFKHEDIFGFSRIKFWNHFFLLIFSAVIWLCFMSIFGATLLDKLINPLKFSSPKSLIIEINPESTQVKTQNKADIVMDFLSKHKDVSNYSQVTQEKLLSILDNFTAQQTKDLGVSLPILIEVKLHTYSDAIVDDLRISISQKVKNVFLDSESDLLSRLISPITGATSIAFLIPLIALLILVGILFLIIYAVILSNKPFIELFIILGIYKTTLYFELAKWILKKSFQASCLGLFIGVISIFILYFLNVSKLISQEYIYFFAGVLLFLPIISAFLGVIFVNKIISRYFYTK